MNYYMSMPRVVMFLSDENLKSFYCLAEVWPDQILLIGVLEDNNADYDVFLKKRDYLAFMP